MASAQTARWETTRTVVPHLREIALMAGVYFLYMYTRKLVFSDIESVALSNARQIVSFEKSLGFFWEPHWQTWTLESAKGAVIFFNWAYIGTFWPIIIITAVTTYMLDRRRYFYYRNVVLVTFVFSLLLFMLFPLAPPRMLGSEFVDTIKQFGPGFYASREAANYYNAFAAMPSLHFTWTAVLGLMYWRMGPRWLKVVGVGYPLLTLLAITITANHYIMDAVAGLAIMLISIASVNLFYSWRTRRRQLLAEVAGPSTEGNPPPATT